MQVLSRKFPIVPQRRGFTLATPPGSCTGLRKRMTIPAQSCGLLLGTAAPGEEPAAARARRIVMTQTPQHSFPNPSHDVLLGPADFIASVPGILGFYPQESAIVVCLLQDTNNGAAYLGPVLRVDLAHTSSMTEMLKDTITDNVLSSLAIVVSRVPNSPLVRDATQELFSAVNAQGRKAIHACWHVSEIAAGTPYCLMFGPAAADLFDAGLSGDWLTGTVASVVAQPTMAPLLAQGALPELDRDDTRTFFDSEANNRSAAGSAFAARAHLRGRKLAQMVNTNPRAVKRELEHACKALTRARPMRFLETDTKARMVEVFANVEDAEIVASMLTQLQLRDCLFATALAHPHSAGAALLALARESEGAIRANALSLWAVVAVKQQLSSWASAALSCAQDEVPDHSLSRMLAGLLRFGEHESVVRSTELGCARMWEELNQAVAN